MALIVAIVVIVGVIIWAVTGAGDYYAISPGTAPVVSDEAACRPVGGGEYALPGGKPCVRIALPAGKASTLAGTIMMVDVLVGPASPSEYFLSELGLLHHVRDGTVLVPKGEILGSTPPSQLNCQNDQQMTAATEAARVVALRHLGYTVEEHDFGAQVDQVGPGTPAAAAGIRCNDLIVAVDGRPIHSAQDLVTVIRGRAPGDTVHLAVSRTGQGAKTESLDLAARLETTPAQGSQPADPKRAFLGVASETRTTFQYPFDVKVEVGQIGGPSAGLALTLGLIDALTEGQLTGGLHVAATGTMDLAGDVGDVGGVAQKAVAVRKAGARVFFVPVQELAAAKSEAGSMKVLAVSNLNQVLDDLRSLGGHVPALAGGQNGSG